MMALTFIAAHLFSVEEDETSEQRKPRAFKFRGGFGRSSKFTLLCNFTGTRVDDKCRNDDRELQWNLHLFLDSLFFRIWWWWWWMAENRILDKSWRSA